MPRFVLLEHDWNGVHWDFMIESADGARLHTWAIDAPVVPGRDLPARRLPDHRTAYLDYEGPLSGDRGSVRRIDEGTFELIRATPEHFELALSGRQLLGRFSLRAVSTGSSDWLARLGNLD